MGPPRARRPANSAREVFRSAHHVVQPRHVEHGLRFRPRFEHSTCTHKPRHRSPLSARCRTPRGRSETGVTAESKTSPGTAARRGYSQSKSFTHAHVRLRSLTDRSTASIHGRRNQRQFLTCGTRAANVGKLLASRPVTCSSQAVKPLSAAHSRVRVLCSQHSPYHPQEPSLE